ncbi:MAG: nuclear transport factor 2 family protein [Actinomycetota bacterium]
MGHDGRHEAAPGTPQELMRCFSERAAAGDGAGLAALYEPGAAFEVAPGQVLGGIDAIRPALEELAALRPAIAYDGEPHVIVVDDIALVANDWTMTATLPDGTRLRQGGRSADVLRRRPDGTWRVLIDQPRGATLAS